MVEDWKRRAERAGVSISRFVVERVEDSIRCEGARRVTSAVLSLIKSLRSAEEELKNLHEENRLLKRLVENLDNELKRYRAQPFLQAGFEGVRTFDKELIDILRGGGTCCEDEMLARLALTRPILSLPFWFLLMWQAYFLFGS